MTDPLDSTQLTPAERALTDEIAGRRDEIVALACDLIRFDTQSREAPDLAGAAGGRAAGLPRRAAARERRRRRDLGARPRRRATTTRWPPEGIGFAGRPQLAARFAGTGGGRSLLLNGHIDVVTARPRTAGRTTRSTRRSATAASSAAARAT